MMAHGSVIMCVYSMAHLELGYADALGQKGLNLGFRRANGVLPLLKELGPIGTR